MLSHRLSPRRLAWALLAVVAVAAMCVWLLGAQPPLWYPPCPLRALTGLHCPGCGSARTLHALAHGDWVRAVALNPLIVLAFPLALAWSAHAFWRALRYNLPPIRPPRRAAAVTLTLLLAFFLLRNLPWWPCTLLAPHG